MEVKKKIALCGFMGCGKTVVGKHLAKKLNTEFINLDSIIEESCGMTISQMFSDFGEEAFREKETQVLREVCLRQEGIIACGGGTILREENEELLKNSGATIVFLDVSADILKLRLKNDTRRPLLQVENRNAVIDSLLAQRRPRYMKAADVSVNIFRSEMGPAATAQKVIRVLEGKGKNNT